jgi:hypothetical protein
MNRISAAVSTEERDAILEAYDRRRRRMVGFFVGLVFGFVFWVWWLW